jgi:hypothetical protein
MLQRNDAGFHVFVRLAAWHGRYAFAVPKWLFRTDFSNFSKKTGAAWQD